MQKIECEYCRGRVIQDGRFWVCENCRTQYLFGQNDEGNPFLYQPIEKKEIEIGQVAQKASEIVTENILVKEIKLSDTIETDVQNESLNLDTQQHVQFLITCLKNHEWDAAQSEINQILLQGDQISEAQWYGWMCNKHLATEESLINSFSTFSSVDATKLDNILGNSTPKFAKHVIELLFEKAYINDRMCSQIMKVIVPYAKSESLYSVVESNRRILEALEIAISKVYSESFDYLLKCIIRSSDVDMYISYLQRFADSCTSLKSRKYYLEILKVDPSNTDANLKLVLADINADIEFNKTIADFENLLKYSQNSDQEVIKMLNVMTSENYTTSNKAELFWRLMGFHSKAPEGLKKDIIIYSKILLKNSLWEQARKFIQLVLSFDSGNAEAYWLLCLAKLQARDEKDVANKKDNLIELPEFRKSYALYQREGNEEMAAELMTFTQKQKETKKHKKNLLIIAIAFVALIVLICIVNAKRHNPRVTINFRDATYDYGWSYSEMPITIQTKAALDVSELDGVMTFYDESNDEITDATFSFSNIQHGKKSKWKITLNSNIASKLDGYDFESVKITFATTAIYFSDGKHKDLGDGKEQVIKKITQKTTKEDKKRKELYEEAVVLFENRDFEKSLELFLKTNGYRDSDSYIERCQEEIYYQKYDEAVFLYDCAEYAKALSIFETISDYSDSSTYIEKIYEKKYREAIDLYNDRAYEQALPLFESVKDYRDSADYIDECKGKIGRKNLGVSINPDYDQTQASIINLPYGAWIDRVQLNSLADNAGIKAHSIITAVNGVPIPDYRYLSLEIDKVKAGETVTITVFESTDAGFTRDTGVYKDYSITF